MTAILQQLGLDMTFYTQFAVFAVLFIFLGQVFFKPFLALLQERHQRTQRDLEAAAAMATETKAKLEDYEARLRSARLEARAEVERAISEAKAEEAQILSEAREGAKRITLENVAGLSAEKERVQAQFDVEAESLATAILEELLLKKKPPNPSLNQKAADHLLKPKGRGATSSAGEISRTSLKTNADFHLLRCQGKATPSFAESALDKVQNVSFPRSGHALLRRALSIYFGDRFHYCEFYTGCGVNPCINSGTNYQKQHDFGLKEKRLPNAKYLVQYRHPIESIVSLYLKGLEDKVIPVDSFRVWYGQLFSQLRFWRSFVKKWVFECNDPNTLMIPYHRLIEHPEFEIRKAVRFMDPKNEPKEDLINGIVKGLDIKKLSSLRDFQYSDDYTYRALERDLKNELQQLNIPFLYDHRGLERTVGFSDLGKFFNDRPIPVFYHVPKCAGTYVRNNLMYAALTKRHRRGERSPLSRADSRRINCYLQVHVSQDGSCRIPGNLVLETVADRNKIEVPESQTLALSPQRVEELIKNEGLLLEGATVSPTSDTASISFKLVENFCYLAGGHPSYFTVLREPVSRQKSFFYYLRDEGKWEPTYGKFEGMTFEQYIRSELVEDSWIIRNIVGKDFSEPLTERDLILAKDVLSRFIVGFVDSMETFEKRLCKKFGWNPADFDKETGGNKNTSSTREPVGELAEVDLEVLRRRIRFDITLYKALRAGA